MAPGPAALRAFLLMTACAVLALVHRLAFRPQDTLLLAGGSGEAPRQRPRLAPFGVGRWFEQPPPDAWTMELSVTPPSAVGLPPSSKPVVGYIVTGSTRTLRYRLAALRVVAAGFYPVPHIGMWPAADTRIHSDHRRLCAVDSAHSRAWERFATDPSSQDGDWAFFFEDDIAFTPPATPASVHLAWARSIASNASRGGFVMMGACGTRRRHVTEGDMLVRSTERAGMGAGAEEALKDVQQAPTCAVCAHAYGLPRDVAATLPSIFERDFPGQEGNCNASYADAVFRGVDVSGAPRPTALRQQAVDDLLVRVCNNGAFSGVTGQFPPLIGANYVSPQFPDHHGVLFQDRRSFSSSNVGNNYGLASNSTVVATRREWELVAKGGPCPGH